MKKRMLAMLMAMCLMLTLVPVAFAQDSQPDTITLPNGEVVEIPDVSDIQIPDEENLRVTMTAPDIAALSETEIPAAGYDGEGTSANPYRVYTGQGLVNLSAKFQSSNMTFSRIYLMNDIDLTDIAVQNDYLFRYFAGVIQSDPALIVAGTPAVIKGLGNKALIYGLFMGTLGYFNVDLDGKPGRLTLIPGTVGGQYLETSVQHVEIYSGSIGETGRKPISLTAADSQANYAPFVFTTGGTFTMTDCVNYADISSNSYGSVFYGYYPIGDAPVTFTRCVNKGTISMRHAAMFFGNNSLFCGERATYFAFNSADPSQNKIQFVDCKNDGKILGTSSANLFATRASGDGATDTLSEAYESYLRSDTVGCMMEDSVQIIGKDLGMALYSDIDGNLTMTASTNTDVAYYIVSVYSYVNIFRTSDDTWYGTDRFGTQEKLENGNTQITLKKYGVCDYMMDTEGLTTEPNTVGGLTVVKYNNTPYYWLDVMQDHNEFYWTVSKTGEPAIKSTPDIITLAAYSSNGTLLGTVSDVAAPTNAG